jgi:hypothetical protein
VPALHGQNNTLHLHCFWWCAHIPIPARCFVHVEPDPAESCRFQASGQNLGIQRYVGLQIEERPVILPPKSPTNWYDCII